MGFWDDEIFEKQGLGKWDFGKWDFGKMRFGKNEILGKWDFGKFWIWANAIWEMGLWDMGLGNLYFGIYGKREVWVNGFWERDLRKWEFVAYKSTVLFHSQFTIYKFFRQKIHLQIYNY